MRVTNENGDREDLPSLAEIYDSYHGWLVTAARGMSDSYATQEELIQEAKIAIWRSLPDFDRSRGTLPSYITQVARRRMVDVVTGRKPTLGKPPAKGIKYSRRDYTEVSVRDREDGATDVNPLWGVMEEAYDGALMAYHYGEINRAVDSLSPAQRRYVKMRFYLGMQTKEMKEHFGYDPSGLWTSQKNGARMKLASKLSHLREAA